MKEKKSCENCKHFETDSIENYTAFCFNCIHNPYYEYLKDCWEAKTK